MTKELTPLEALSFMLINCLEYDNLDKHYDIIEKSLKALEIIKRHLFLQYSDKLCVYTLCQWVDKDSWRIIQTLTQEEFGLLKEVLL